MKKKKERKISTYKERDTWWFIAASIARKFDNFTVYSLRNRSRGRNSGGSRAAFKEKRLHYASRERVTISRNGYADSPVIGRFINRPRLPSLPFPSLRKNIRKVFRAGVIIEIGLVSIKESSNDLNVTRKLRSFRRRLNPALDFVLSSLLINLSIDDLVNA